MIAEFSIYPVDGAHVGTEQARVADELEASGMPYRLGPMSTCVEGDWDDVMAAIRRCQEAVAERHDRVVTTVVLDERKTSGQHLDEIVRSIRQHRGRAARKGEVDAEC